VTKTKAHRNIETIEDEGERQLAQGNAAVDELARRGAASHPLRGEAAEEALHCHTFNKRVLKAIGNFLASLPSVWEIFEPREAGQGADDHNDGPHEADEEIAAEWWGADAGQLSGPAEGTPAAPSQAATPTAAASSGADAGRLSGPAGADMRAPSQAATPTDLIVVAAPIEGADAGRLSGPAGSGNGALGDTEDERRAPAETGGNVLTVPAAPSQAAEPTDLKHAWQLVQGRWRCKHCLRQSQAASTEEADGAVRVPCGKFPETLSQAASVDQGHSLLATRTVDTGTWFLWCSKCGGWASAKAATLRTKCVHKPKSGWARGVLFAVGRLRHPSSGESLHRPWPFDGIAR